MKSWRTYIDKAAADYQRIAKIDDFDTARRFLIAKMIGRWPDGVPLSKAPTPQAHAAFLAELAKLPDTPEGAGRSAAPSSIFPTPTISTAPPAR